MYQYLPQEVFPAMTLVAWKGGHGEGELIGGAEESLCWEELHRSPGLGKDK